MHAFTIRIPGSKEEAKLEVAADRSVVSVFSDGSGQEGGVGAAAVLYRGRAEKCMLRKFMYTSIIHKLACHHFHFPPACTGPFHMVSCMSLCLSSSRLIWLEHGPTWACERVDATTNNICYANHG